MNSLLGYSYFHLDIKKDRNFFFIKDPIHQEIIFSEDQFWLYELINTYEFQRLNKIRQLAFTYINFPSAVHTRFIHCLGTFHLCNKFISQFIYNKELCPQKNKYEINIALAAALLHDIGHGPFSHTFEKAWDFSHELIALKILSDSRTKINFLLKKKAINDKLPEDFYIKEISKVLNKTSEYKWIVDLISSEIDIDRLDYLARDSHFTGLSYGGVDLTILIKWSTLKEENGKKIFLFLDKARYILSNFLICRRYMYLELYENKISALYEYLLVLIISEFKRLYSEVEDKERYKKIEFLMGDMKSWDIVEFLGLDDENFYEIISGLAFSNVSILKNLTNLFLSRDDKTNLKMVFLNEKEYKKYQDFIKEYSTELDYISSNIYGKKCNISESIFLWNSLTKSKYKFSLNLSEYQTTPSPPLYILIINKDRYKKLVEYGSN